MVSLPDQHHDKAVISEHKIDNFNLCPKILIKKMINSDQLVVAEVLPSDLPECQPEEQDKGGDGSLTEYSEKEVIACDDDVDDGEEESELDKKEDFSDAEFSAIPSENNESLYSSDSDWSDEEYAENPTESKDSWNSLNNSVPDNPVYFCLNGTKTKASSTKKTGKKVCFSKEVTVHILEEWPLESQEAQDESYELAFAITEVQTPEKKNEITTTCFSKNGSRMIFHYTLSAR
ncbi:hypothetical protein C0J45_2701 [Silurus meridionalis]|nr:hypothetical protein C0J45_2701 [Silurus meridionalis]